MSTQRRFDQIDPLADLREDMEKQDDQVTQTQQRRPQTQQRRTQTQQVQPKPQQRRTQTQQRGTQTQQRRTQTQQRRTQTQQTQPKTQQRRTQTKKRPTTTKKTTKLATKRSTKRDRKDEKIDISNVKYYAAKGFINKMLSQPAPYVQGDKNDVVTTLQNRAVEVDNVSYVHNIGTALSILKSNYMLPNYTIALLYRYAPTNNNNHLNINQIDTEDDYERLRGLANDSDVWIFLTNVSECNTPQQSKIHTEIRVRTNSWGKLDTDTRKCIMIIDKYLDQYLMDITMPKTYNCPPQTYNICESIEESEYISEEIDGYIKYSKIGDDISSNGENTIVMFPEGTEDARQQEIMNYMKQNEAEEDEDVDEQTSKDKEIIVYSNDNNETKVFEIDPSQVDPRTFRDVERISAALLFLDALFGPILAILDLAFIAAELLEKFWPLIERTLAEGEGGVGDFFRRLFRRALFRIKGEWIEAYKNLPEEEAKKIILNDILEESKKLQGNPEKARKRLRSLSVDQLKYFGKDVLLDLLSFNNILSDNQRKLIYLSGIVTELDVRNYLKERQNDPRFEELEEHVAKKFENSDEQLVNTKINYSHLYKHKLYVGDEFYTQPIGEAISVGTAIVVVGVLGLIGTLGVGVIGGGATLSVPVVKEFLRTMRKGEGGLGDKLRTRFRGAKRFIRKSFLKRIKGKSDEEIVDIFNEELAEKIKNTSPEEMIEELRNLPIGQLASLGEETLTTLLSNELLTIEQVTLLQLSGAVNQEMLTGTIYSEDYLEDLKGRGINDLITLSDNRIRLLLRGQGFTDDQVVEMLVAEKIFLRHLRGTPYDYGKIKKKFKKAKKNKK